MRGRFARLPLRSRLALLTAVAVTIAVAVCALAAWFLVRGQLRSSLDDALRDSRVSAELLRVWQLDQCVTAENAGTAPEEVPRPPVTYVVQVVEADGRSCTVYGDETLPVVSGDVAVAAGSERTAGHDVTGSDGTPYRVLTRELRDAVEGLPPDAAGLPDDIAVSVARPLTEVNDSLRSLAVVLTLVAVGGAVGSAGVGVALARAGLRPVDRLTAVTEHIARTEDLSVRIPVDGDDEIARLSEAFNSMTAALASSRELQQQLIADAGHELRTPLTSLRTNIELLARSEETGRPLPEADRRDLLASVTAQLGELAALIGDLQELSRPERTAGSGRLEVVGLHDVAARAVTRARLRARDLPVDARLDPWYVRAEPAGLERAVVNLLDNAVKFGRQPDGSVAGPVEVTLGGGVLRIRDHGPGIAPADLPHVFERFWRSPTARGLPGSGLGLSIVARTVRECGGDVLLRPAPGGGTEAVLTLPGAPVPPPGGAGDD